MDMAQCVHMSTSRFCNCNRCGGLTKDIYYLSDTHSMYCPECFDQTTGYTESGECMVMDGPLFEEMMDSIRNGNGFSSWYLYGRKDTEGRCTRWIVDTSIPWGHDRLGRPKFSPADNMPRMMNLMREGKKCLVTAITAPNLRNASDEVLRRYAAYADTPLVYLVDCNNHRTKTCYKNTDSGLQEIVSVVA